MQKLGRFQALIHLRHGKTLKIQRISELNTILPLIMSELLQPDRSLFVYSLSNWEGLHFFIYLCFPHKLFFFHLSHPSPITVYLPFSCFQLSITASIQSLQTTNKHDHHE